MMRFCLEVLCIVLTVFALIFAVDVYGVFDYDQSNNHTGKRWSYLYRQRKSVPPDILILGNSHAYTGILPKEMSCALGSTCFVLASQGNFLTDAYHMLDEALEIVHPKLLIIETYLIREYDQKNLKNGDLTCQIQSFEARGNVWKKICSAPSLFMPDNIPYAWSPTLRNHSYIFENRRQLAVNLKSSGQEKWNDRLYLGRYVRFQSGLEQDVLERYEKEGAPVDGTSMTVSEDAFKAMEKIDRLCRRKGVDVMFLTIPMYKEHVSSYDVWKSNVAELVERYPYPWLDLQEDYDDELFDKDCFENTYRQNQHLTAQGALVCTYKLADHIRRNYPALVVDNPSERWQRAFYGEDGYFESRSPLPGDKNNLVICRNIAVGEMKVSEALYASYPRYSKLMVKLGKDGAMPEMVPCLVAFQEKQGQVRTMRVELERERYFSNPDYGLYSLRLKKGLTLKDFKFIMP